MHLFTCFFLLWPLITLCYHLGILSNLLGPQLSQKISNTADSYLDHTDLVFSEYNWPYSGTSGLDIAVLASYTLSRTQKSECSINIHNIVYGVDYIICFSDL